MMGSGKTTVGKTLSKFLKLKMVDTDKIIEKKCGIKIKRIFEKYGEKYFRKKEEVIILKILSSNKPCVIALGGGAFLNKKLQKIILKKTISIWLDASLKLIYNRCRKSNTRPLLNNNNVKDLKKEINEILKLRKPVYSKAQFKITSNKTPKMLSKEILKCLKNVGFIE